MKTVLLSMALLLIGVLPACTHPAALPQNELELGHVRISPNLKVALPLHWWLDPVWLYDPDPPMRYDEILAIYVAEADRNDEDASMPPHLESGVASFGPEADNIAAYVNPNCGSTPFGLNLKSNNGSMIAHIYFDVATYIEGDFDWRSPEELLTQTRLRQAGPLWLKAALRSGQDDFKKYAFYKRRINNLLIAVNESYEDFSEGGPPGQHNAWRTQNLWRTISILIPDGCNSARLTLCYDMAYAEQLEPLMREIMRSLEFDPYPSNIIKGRLNDNRQTVTVFLANIWGHTVSLDLPADWRVAQMNPVTLDANDKLFSQSQAELGELLATGQLTTYNTNHDFYAARLDAKGDTFAQISFIFTDPSTMYTKPDYDAGIDNSKSARHMFDKTIVEKLEGCRVSRWQEHGNVLGKAGLLHDSFIKTCGSAVYQVNTVKYLAVEKNLSFIFTASYLVENQNAMREPIDNIIRSLDVQ